MLNQTLSMLLMIALSTITGITQDLNSALLKAAEAGDTARVEALLAQGAAVNATSSHQTPLTLAASKGHLETVKVLLAKGAEINPKDSFHSPLHYALFEGRSFGQEKATCASCIAVAEYLIANGADINATNATHDTPLHVAARHGQLSIAKLLLAKGAGVNAKGYSGYTPLHHAASEGHLALAELLLANGAEINAKNEFGKAPLDVATDDDATEGSASVAALLIGKGANLTATNKANQSLLHITARKGQLPLVKSLLAKRVDVNAKDKFGYTPLHYAAKEGHLAVAEALIAKGARANIENTFGKTPLDLAKDDPMAQLLTRSGPRPPVSVRQRQATPAKQRAQLINQPSPLVRMKGAWTMSSVVMDMGPPKGRVGFGFSSPVKSSERVVIDQPDPHTITFSLDDYILTLKHYVETKSYRITLIDPRSRRKLIDDLALAYSAREGFFISSESEETTPFVSIRFAGATSHQWAIKIESPNSNHTFRKYDITFTKP